MTEISSKRLRHCPLLVLCSRQVRWNLLSPKVTSEKRDDQDFVRRVLVRLAFMPLFAREPYSMIWCHSFIESSVFKVEYFTTLVDAIQKKEDVLVVSWLIFAYCIQQCNGSPGSTVRSSQLRLCVRDVIRNRAHDQSPGLDDPSFFPSFTLNPKTFPISRAVPSLLCRFTL
jgi:hypothetical protein